MLSRTFLRRDTMSKNGIKRWFTHPVTETETRYTLYASGFGAVAFAGIAFLTGEVLLSVLLVFAAVIAFNGAFPRPEEDRE